MWNQKKKKKNPKKPNYKKNRFVVTKDRRWGRGNWRKGQKVQTSGYKFKGCNVQCDDYS